MIAKSAESAPVLTFTQSTAGAPLVAREALVVVGDEAHAQAVAAGDRDRVAGHGAGVGVDDDGCHSAGFSRSAGGRYWAARMFCSASATVSAMRFARVSGRLALVTQNRMMRFA